MKKRTTPKLTRSAREKRMREKIKKAAFTLMAEKGLEKVSMREIAEKVEVTKPVLYYYFKNKEDLCASIIEEHEEAFGAMLGQVSREACSPEEILSKSLHSHLDFFTRNPFNSKFVIQMISYTLTAEKITPRRKKVSTHHLLEEALEREVKKGSLPAQSSADVLALITALSADIMLNAYLHQHVAKKMTDPFPKKGGLYGKKDVDRLVKIILLGIGEYYKGKK